MNITKSICLLAISLLLSINLNSQTADKTDWMGGYPEGCTSITIGKDASFDGSVMTSHTDDSHRTRSWVDIVPPKTHKKGDEVIMYKRVKDDSLAMPAYLSVSELTDPLRQLKEKTFSGHCQLIFLDSSESIFYKIRNIASHWGMV